ncbi:MAG TPA: hypothetical protein VGE98_00885, partial [Thermoanaerobaculia bacterium]
MKDKGMPLPLWLAVLIAAGSLYSGTFASRPPADAAAGSAAKATAAKTTEADAAAEAVAEPSGLGWRDPVRLYREFFGLAPLPASDKSPAFAPLAAELRREAAARGYALQALVATVPDPLDSQVPADFDKAVDAIQKGLVHAGYLPDRIWIPWAAEGASGTDPAKKVYRGSPGLLLFRKFVDSTATEPAHRELLSVFLIGETPK